MKHTKPAARYLAILLALLLALSSSAFAAPAADGQAAEDSADGLFLSLSEKQNQELNYYTLFSCFGQLFFLSADKLVCLFAACSGKGAVIS